MTRNNVVYLHTRKDSNDVFYVGIGNNKRRAYSRAGRNEDWHKEANEGYNVHLINEDLSIEDAFAIERELIQTFGRMKNGGQLVNRSSGGSYGSTGMTHSEELKEAVSRRFKGVPKTEEHKRKLSAAAKGKKRPYLTNTHNCIPTTVDGVTYASRGEARKAGAFNKHKEPRFKIVPCSYCGKETRKKNYQLRVVANPCCSRACRNKFYPRQKKQK